MHCISNLIGEKKPLMTKEPHTKSDLIELQAVYYNYKNVLLCSAHRKEFFIASN